MKISQIAIWVPDSAHEKAISLSNKFKDSSVQVDDLLMDGEFNGIKCDGIRIKLLFVFGAIKDCEIEFIESKDRRHWHREFENLYGNMPFISHMGVYCESDDEYKMCKDLFSEYPILQETVSYGHTNKREIDKEESSRAYADIIFNTFADFGFNIKFTKRI